MSEADPTLETIGERGEILGEFIKASTVELRYLSAVLTATRAVRSNNQASAALSKCSEKMRASQDAQTAAFHEAVK